jgi:chromate transporter
MWLGLGFQSFGGGAATLALIRRAAVDKYGWLTPDDFMRDWALSQVSPGINLLGITTLIGRRVLGIPGIVIALFGLLLPSCVITVLITACYAHFEGAPAVRAALRGVIPATVGVGLVTCYQLGAPLIDVSRREGRASIGVSLATVVVSAVVSLVWRTPVVLILCVAGAIGAVYHVLQERAV